jgi:hypothetical protein
MAVEVKTTPVFEAGESKALFYSRISRTGEVTNPFHYAITAGASSFTPITVVLNWTAGLKQ